MIYRYFFLFVFLLSFHSSVYSQLFTFRVGYDIVSNHRAKSDVQNLDIDDIRRVDPSFLVAVEFGGSSTYFMYNIGLETSFKRTITDIDGSFNFFSGYAVIRMKLPLPYPPVIGFRVGANNYDGNSTYTDRYYEGIEYNGIGSTVRLAHSGLYHFGFGTGLIISDHILIEGWYIKHHGVRSYDEIVPLMGILRRDFNIEFERFFISIGYVL